MKKLRIPSNEKAKNQDLNYKMQLMCTDGMMVQLRLVEDVY